MCTYTHVNIPHHTHTHHTKWLPWSQKYTPISLVTSNASTICSLLDHLLDAKLVCLLCVVCPSRGPFLLRWTALITSGRWEISGELVGRTEGCWLPSGLPVHLACSGHSQACVSDGNETLPILSILVHKSKVFGELFIKDWQVSTTQRRQNPLIITAELCPTRETVPTTCHSLAAPHSGTQTVCNWKSPTFVTFKSGMKNGQLATEAPRGHRIFRPCLSQGVVA